MILSLINNNLLSCLLIYRLLCLLLTLNYEYPDQHWQGPEIAHHLHYGYGYLTWQWTMAEPLRNPVYPYVLSLGYYLADLLGWHSQWGPKLVQMGVAVGADWGLLGMVREVYGGVSGWAVVLVLGNWYWASAMTRCYFNSFETAIVVLGVYHWLRRARLGETDRRDVVSRLCATVGYVARPTSVVVWGLLWPYELVEVMRVHGVLSLRAVKFVMKNVVNIFIMLGLSLGVASWFYGRYTLTQASFIKYNFIEKWSQLYGKQPTWFYFIITLPFTVNFCLIFTVMSLLKLYLDPSRKKKAATPPNIKSLRIVLTFCLGYLLISSLSTHKQHRFILPVVPFLLVLSLYPLEVPTFRLFGIKIPFKVKKIILGIIIITNVLLFGFFSVYGKSSGPEAWSYIDEQISKKGLKDNQTNIIVIGEAHFMPGYSLLHRDVGYRLPDCSAPRMAQNSSEAKLLTENPVKLFGILTQDGQIQPDFIIVQGKYFKNLAIFLAGRKYFESRTWRHCTVPEQLVFGYDSISIFEQSSHSSRMMHSHHHSHK